MLMLTLLRYLLVGSVMVLVASTSSSSADKPLQEDVIHASKDTPDAKPQLVIEAGGHRGIIRELLFTANGRELISVSDDKTVRVWTVSPDGRHVVLGRTIRGQMGNGREGMLAAATLSPPNAKGEQQWLAVGGFLAGSPSYRHAIRLHDYASGEVRALLQGHTDLVLALAFSPSGRWLASAAKDNTVRLWDLSSLENQKLTKAPLVLTEHTDHIYDLAWSPSGHRLVSASYDHTVGMWATEDLNQENVRFIGRLRGHQNQVTTVAFHPQGAVFASGGKDQTIRLWNAQDGSSLGIFAKTAQQVAALAFSPDGNLLLAGRIGGTDTPKQITLFAYPSGNQQQVFTEHQNIVLATAFHPNGRWIASAGGEQKELILWDATTGATLSRLQGGSATIWAVAFSRDSKVLSWGHLFAGDSAISRGPLEHRFDLSTLKRLQGGLTNSEAVRGQDHIGQLRLLLERSGPLNYASHLDIWRQEQGSRTKLHTFVRDADHGYRHSAYTFTPDGQHVLSGGLNGSLSLYTLEGDVRARLEGHTGEIKAITVSADGQWALSGGTDQTLRLWSLSTLPASGSVTLMPALSLFPSQDGEWIAWTPDGFFASSTNGSQLMGYSLNQGLDKLAQYISIDQLYDRFYRPDRVFEKLQQPTLKREGALHEVDKVLSSGLPPQVEFISPLTTSMSEQRSINVQVMVKDQGGGIGKIVWKVDGITVAIDHDSNIFASRQVIPQPMLPTDEQVLQLAQQITRSEVPSTISVVAYNRSNDIASEPAILALEGTPPPPPAAALTVATADVAPPRPATALPAPSPANGASVPSDAAGVPTRPDLYLIVVGVSHYRDRALWLNYAVSDAQALANTLCAVASPLFRSITIKQVFDEQATLAGLDAAFKDIAARAKPDDVFVLYLAGHGITQEGRYYFLPQDFRYRQEDSVSQEAINQDHLQHWLASIQARKSLVLIDTCESGSFSQFQAKLQARSVAEKTAIAKLTRATGRATIVASTDVQLALEGIEGHGVFTYVLLQALRQADTTLGNRDGLNSFFELAQYIDDRVPQITMEAFGYEQVPQISMVGSDFPIGVVNAPEQCAHCCERY